VARNRQRAKARKSKARQQAQSPSTQEALETELHSTLEPPDPIANASGDAELAKAAELVASEPVESGDELPDDNELDELEAEDEREHEPERGARAPTGTGQALPKGGNRLINFIRACWAELQRVQWPDRRQVFQATGVVLGFVVIAGAYLGLADLVVSRIVNAIL
jgi:preprotein translocase subunit SecE